MSAKQSKKSILSLIFRKTSTKPNNVIQLSTKTIAISEKSNMTDSEVELLNKYYNQESIMTTLDTVEHIITFKHNHIRRLSQEKSCISDMKDMVINSGDSVLLGLLNRWTTSVKNSIENLNETLESFYSEHIEPTACFHLNRSIVHLVNLYETISEISKLSEETYAHNMYGYLNTMVKCITDFRTDFIKYCREISNYISDFKQTLTLLINRHPENRLVIHAMNDIEKLYNYSLEITNKINTSTPLELEKSIGYIDKISNDINDIKSDLINVKHHQEKDKKYVTSSYV
jgi:hypothetical protein